MAAHLTPLHTGGQGGERAPRAPAGRGRAAAGRDGAPAGPRGEAVRGAGAAGPAGRPLHGAGPGDHTAPPTPAVGRGLAPAAGVPRVSPRDRGPGGSSPPRPPCAPKCHTRAVEEEGGRRPVPKQGRNACVCPALVPLLRATPSCVCTVCAPEAGSPVLRPGKSNRWWPRRLQQRRRKAAWTLLGKEAWESGQSLGEFSWGPRGGGAP